MFSLGKPDLLGGPKTKTWPVIQFPDPRINAVLKSTVLSCFWMFRVKTKPSSLEKGFYTQLVGVQSPDKAVSLGEGVLHILLDFYWLAHLGPVGSVQSPDEAASLGEYILHILLDFYWLAHLGPVGGV